MVVFFLSLKPQPPPTSCRFFRPLPPPRSYHCPNLDTDGYPRWMPRQESSGACNSKTKKALELDPLPPGFKALFYGNSHLRQASTPHPRSPVCRPRAAVERALARVRARETSVHQAIVALKSVPVLSGSLFSDLPLSSSCCSWQVVEGIVCAYSGVIRSRKLSLLDVVSGERPNEVQAVGPNRQCRSCAYSYKKSQRLLLESECVSEEEVEEACRSVGFCWGWCFVS